MRLFNIILAALGATFILNAQTDTNTGKVLVVKTVDGQTARYPLANIEEMTFEDYVAPTPGSVTVSSVENLSPSFFSLSGISTGDELTSGKTATITLTAGQNLPNGFSDYHLMHLHLHVNDKVIVPKVTESFENNTQSLKIDFIVPENECKITACYSVQQQFIEDGFTMTLEDNPSVRLFGVSPEEHYKYFDAYLKVDEAFVITSVEYRMGNGEWLDAKESYGCDWSKDEDVEDLYRVKIRPGYSNVTGDVVLRVKGEQHKRYNIQWNNATSQYLDTEKSIFPTKAIDGDEVIAEIWMNNEYYLNGATANAGVTPELLQGAYIRFTMPKSDVNVDLDIRAKVPVAYTGSEHVLTADIYDADDMYYGRPTAIGVPGQDVYCFVTAEEGYKPMTATNDAGVKSNFEYYGNNIYMVAITIPVDAKSLNFTVQCAVAHSVSSEQVVVFNDGNLYADGENVSMAIQVPAGKQIEKVTATTKSGADVTVTLDLPYASFIMPDEDVTITVTYTDLSSEDTVSVIAYYDEDEYRVRSTTNYDWNFLEGFNTDKGSTIYVTVEDFYGENFCVGVKIGDNLTIYHATEDEESGEYTFGKALTLTGNTIIKVGPNENSVTF